MRTFRFLDGCLLLLILSVLSSCNKDIPIPETEQPTTSTEAKQLTSVVAQQSAQRTRNEALLLRANFFRAKKV